MHMAVQKQTIVSDGVEQHPRTLEDVERSMGEMDRRYGTHFAEWIKSETNVSYICTFKKELFHEFMKKDPNIVATAIRWLTEDWGVATVAELVLKLFYSYRIDSVMFADLVQAVSVDWPRSKQLDLFNILLIGESAATTARFFYNTTRGITFGENNPEYAARQWMLHEKIDFLQSCSNTLRWGPVFAREFLMNYSGLVMKEDVVKMKKLQEDIMDTFECVTADSTTLCLALFMDVEEVDLVNGFEELCMASPVLERCDSGLAGLEVDEKLK